MSDFGATLTRAFAEAHEPADDGFSVRVAEAVGRREQVALWLLVIQGVGIAAAAAAIAWGLMSVFGVFVPDVVAVAGFEIARAQGMLTQTPNVSIDLNATAAGLTQILFVLAGLAGGAAVYRSSQA
jgi:hypothetical protein